MRFLTVLDVIKIPSSLFIKTVIDSKAKRLARLTGSKKNKQQQISIGCT